MARILNSFSLQTPLPLDERTVVGTGQTYATRAALLADGHVYKGLIVYDLTDDMRYIWTGDNGATTGDHWMVVGSGGQTTNAVEDFPIGLGDGETFQLRNGETYYQRQHAVGRGLWTWDGDDVVLTADNLIDYVQGSDTTEAADWAPGGLIIIDNAPDLRLEDSATGTITINTNVAAQWPTRTPIYVRNGGVLVGGIGIGRGFYTRFSETVDRSIWTVVDGPGSVFDIGTWPVLPSNATPEQIASHTIVVTNLFITGFITVGDSVEYDGGRYIWIGTSQGLISSTEVASTTPGVDTRWYEIGGGAGTGADVIADTFLGIDEIPMFRTADFAATGSQFTDANTLVIVFADEATATRFNNNSNVDPFLVTHDADDVSRVYKISGIGLATGSALTQNGATITIDLSNDNVQRFTGNAFPAGTGFPIGVSVSGAFPSIHFRDLVRNIASGPLADYTINGTPSATDNTLHWVDVNTLEWQEPASGTTDVNDILLGSLVTQRGFFLPRPSLPATPSTTNAVGGVPFAVPVSDTLNFDTYVRTTRNWANNQVFYWPGTTDPGFYIVTDRTNITAGVVNTPVGLGGISAWTFDVYHGQLAGEAVRFYLYDTVNRAWFQTPANGSIITDRTPLVSGTYMTYNYNTI